MHQIRLAAKADNPDTPYPYEKIGDELNIDDDIADQFEDWIDEAMQEFRCSGEPSGIKCPTYSRHYECEERARVLDNGKAVGWTTGTEEASTENRKPSIGFKMLTLSM